MSELERRPRERRPAASREGPARRFLARHSRRGVVLGFFVFIELSIVLLSALAISLSTEAVRRNAHDGAHRVAGASVVAVHQRLLGVFSAVDDASQGPEAVRMVQVIPPTAKDLDALNARLASMISSGSGFKRVFMTDADGNVIATQPANPALIGASLAGEEWFQLAQTSNRISAGVLGTVDGAPIGRSLGSKREIPIAGPIPGPGAGAVSRGYVVAAYDLGQIASFVDGVGRSVGLYLTIVDAKQLVIARPTSREGWVSTRIDGGLVRGALSGHASLIDSQGSKGPIFSVYSPQAGSDWVLITDIPAAAAYDEVERLKYTVVVLGIVLGIALLAGMAVGMRQLGRLQRSALDSQRAEAMSRLNDAARLVHSEQGPAVLDRIVETAMSLGSCDFAALIVFHQNSTSELESVTHRGPMELRPASFPALAKLLFATHGAERLMRIGDARQLIPAGQEADHPRLGPLLAVPLDGGDRVLGMLAVARRPGEGPFDPVTEGLVQELSHHAVTGILKARHDQELNDKNDELAQASRLKSEFLANMSHELRTPLAAIIGFSDLLLDGADGELTADQGDDIGQINRSGRSLLQLINEILDLSKIEAGRMEFEIEAVSIPAMVEEVVAALRPLADSKGLWLRSQVPGSELIAFCDPLRVRQVLTNLVSNAIKFTAEGGVTIRCQENLEVSVVDTGIGIPAEAQKRIFEEFTQADSTTTGRFGGTGLGLSISRKLIELQGGKMGVESKVGEGSRFWFRLPSGEGSPEETASGSAASAKDAMAVIGP